MPTRGVQLKGTDQVQEVIELMVSVNVVWSVL